MAKKPKMWQRGANCAWYVTIQGVQILLGKDEEEAEREHRASCGWECKQRATGRRLAGHISGMGRNQSRSVNELTSYLNLAAGYFMRRSQTQMTGAGQTLLMRTR